MSNSIDPRIQALADLVLKHTKEHLARDYSGWQADAATVSIVPGKKYTKIDRDRGHGYLMVEHETGFIYGIEGYGRPNKRYRYGTLNTIGEWNWGDGPVRVTTETAR